jgi:hypothetical protein
MYDRKHEHINVNASFAPFKITINSFEWRERFYNVKEMHLIMKAGKGRETVWIFSVSTDSAAFKLRFDSDSLEWFLEELVWDEAADSI